MKPTCLRVSLILLLIFLIWTAAEVVGRSAINSSSKKIMASLSLASIVSLSLLSSFPQSINAVEVSGAVLFESSCSGCHSGGGNIFNRQKTLSKAALLKNGYKSPEALDTIISNGQRIMPAYASFISPKGNVIPAKLTPEQIRAVSLYVLEEAEKGWVQEEVGILIPIKKNCDEYPGC